MPVRYRAIVPKELLTNPHKVKEVIANTLKDVALAAKIDFEVTTQTWKHQPKFEIKLIGHKAALVYTTDQRYNWINDGTDPYVIRPKRAARLRFTVPFRAKTVPGAIRSRKGSHGRKVVYARVVHHPGIAARKFDEAVQKKWQPQFPIIMQQALDSAIE